MSFFSKKLAVAVFLVNDASAVQLQKLRPADVATGFGEKCDAILPAAPIDGPTCAKACAQTAKDGADKMGKNQGADQGAAKMSAGDSGTQGWLDFTKECQCKHPEANTLHTLCRAQNPDCPDTVIDEAKCTSDYCDKAKNGAKSKANTFKAAEKKDDADELKTAGSCTCDDPTTYSCKVTKWAPKTPPKRDAKCAEVITKQAAMKAAIEDAKVKEVCDAAKTNFAEKEADKDGKFPIQDKYKCEKTDGQHAEDAQVADNLKKCKDDVWDKAPAETKSDGSSGSS